MSSTTLEPELTTAPAAEASQLSARDRIRVGMSLAWLRIKEYVTCESRLARGAFAVAGYCTAVVLGWLGLQELQFKLLCRLHRADVSTATNQWAERVAARTASGEAPRVAQSLDDYIKHLCPSPGTARFFENPAALLGPAVIVLKSPRDGEKGLVYAHYNHVLPVLARFFDLPKIAERYHIAIEPSWSGFCDPDVLAYCRYRFPVFVSAYEPRDGELVRSTRSNLVPVPLSTNWWVDHRTFFPIPGAAKDIDVVMLAGWGAYKRHAPFFAALSSLRGQGHRLRVLLIGYPVSLTKDVVIKQARYYGVASQLEILEGVPYERVNEQVNRAKIGVIWSRKEGVNRAIIECMFAGVPSLVREGFNYGYRYPYINNQTGGFADEATLPRAMLELIDRASVMDPRSWVMEHMSCQRATQILSDAIGRWCAEHSEPWTEQPVTKVTHLHSMQYWNAADAERFRADYEWLASKRRA
jgi:glycosyltransferase involved in cell wall biosynthesis